MTVATISPEQLNEMIKTGRGVELIDVRTPAEFRAIHISQARNVPLSHLNAGTLAADRKETCEPLYVICWSGARGKQACEKLQAAGCRNVVHVEGGTQAWAEADLPVVRGQVTISLERQVRIAAGFLVLIGAVLGYFVDPYWIALSALVGVGLIFAGVTDTCGMAMLLAKLPWNQT